MNKLLMVVTAIVLGTVFSQLAKLGLKEYQQFSSQNAIEKQILEMNEQMPIHLGENTSIVEVKLDDDVITYMGILRGLEFDEMNLAKFKAAQEITNLFFVCNNKDTKYLLNEDYSVSYNYSTQDGKDLFVNVISYTDCLPFNMKSSKDFGDFFVNLNRKILPMKLDLDTIWIDVRNSNGAMELVYQLTNYYKEELDVENFKKAVKNNSVQKNCIAPDMKILFEKGYIVTDTYVDRVGDVVYSFQTTRNMC